MIYTPEQRGIIRHPGNAVVIARPGSGKTATLAQIIKDRLITLPEHRGVIAISYTNKASAELRDRSLVGGFDKKCSFFGTIDRFFIAEIVIGFGRHLWGAPQNELSVTKNAELPPELQIAELTEEDEGEEVAREEIDFAALLPQIVDLYRRGFILLEAVGFLACDLFTNSSACRRYIIARYTDLIIDEYQDCDYWQHYFFLLATDAGLRAIAVGDLDQSIFLFAKKEAKYLKQLRKDPRFVRFYLTLNHRSHASIAEYAARFISVEHVIPVGLETRVYDKKVVGSEREIGEWLNYAIPAAVELFDVRIRNQVGILVKNKRTAHLVESALEIPYKYSAPTVLDEDSSPAASLFRDLLQWVFDPFGTRRGFVDSHLPPETRGPIIRKVVGMLADLQTAAMGAELSERIDYFLDLTRIINGRPASKQAVERLRAVVSSEEALDTFIAPNSDQVQLLTIHKAKGLEFDVIFHLDLYKYILPGYKSEGIDLEQDSNLHYVALTRAKKACFLCTSTERHNYQGRRLEAQPSPFLFTNGVDRFRQRSPF